MSLENNNGLFEEILKDDILTVIAEYLYDDADVTIDNGGYVESVELPSFDRALEVADITKEDYTRICDAIDTQARKVRYYDSYILLNDNATLNDINNPEFNEIDYTISVEDACTKFELETGLELLLLGRSGRRVCVEDSFSSFINYDYLKEVQEKLEKEVIAKHTVEESIETITESDDTQYIIVGITKEGTRQFYNVSSAPHWVDDCDDATIFNDQSEAHKIFYEIDKKPFKRVFVPNFDRAALKEELDINKIDEDEFLTVTEQIASFLKGMGMDMDDVSGKITHYDVNMFTDCCEDRIRIKWTSYMDKKRVKSNSKILPAMLTQMMADDTRFDEVVDIFINEVDNEVIHHSDLGAISVEMIASDEFEPKTNVEEVKEAYVHAKSEDDIREIDTGLTHKIDYIILGDVQGQLSDGIWENSPAMNKYWKHLDTEFKDGKVFIVVNNLGHMEDVYRGTRRDYRFLESPFRHMSDDEIKKWVANKIKQIAKHEAQDNDNAPEYAWRADNDTELEYFDSVVTVADAYRTWSKLLGRPVKNPINDIIIKTTPELEIGDVINGKVLAEIKPDEKDNYWSYLVFENGDEQKVGKHQNHKVNKPTEETFNESVEDENKFAQYVFPLFTKEDKEKAKYYGLVVDDEDEDNTYVSGSYKDIKSFADNYLGYKLVDDYLTIYESKECKESVYAEEPASKEEIELELKNITHNFTDRQGTAKCSFKEEADIGHDILKQHYDKVRVEEQGEWYHLIYKDLLELDESIKEDIGADDEVIIGLYGDEVSGFDSVDQLAKSFEDNGIEVIYKSGDMEYGWDLEVKGNARDIYRLVNGKLTGYNCNSTQEFVDRYRIDESKCTNESLLQDLQKDHNAVKDTYGQEVYDALNVYIENGNDLGNVLYRESEWNKFVDWAKKEKGIEVKSNLEESKFIKESFSDFDAVDEFCNAINTKLGVDAFRHSFGGMVSFDKHQFVNKEIFNSMCTDNSVIWETLTELGYVYDDKEGAYTKGNLYVFILANGSEQSHSVQFFEDESKSIKEDVDDDKYTESELIAIGNKIAGACRTGRTFISDWYHRHQLNIGIAWDYEERMHDIAEKIVYELGLSNRDYTFDNNFIEVDVTDIIDLKESKSIKEDFSSITALADDCGKNTFKVSTRDIRFTFENENDKTKFVDELSSSNIPHNELTFGVISINKSDALNESKSIKESKEMVKTILSKQLKDNKVKPFKDAKECPRGFAFKSSNGSSGQVRYNGKDYVFAVVDGELRVMTDAEAGSNWSETIYKK